MTQFFNNKQVLMENVSFQDPKAHTGDGNLSHYWKEMTIAISYNLRFHFESCIIELLRKICQFKSIDEVVRLF